MHEADHSPEDYSIFSYNGHSILNITKKLLLWKSVHGIAISALNDPLITFLLQDDTLFSDKTNQKIIKSMANQIIESNFGLGENKKISIIFDG